ncbi:beta-glucuronidase [Acidithrix sp. C25]|uniref:Beta-glucuronidase n=1 Tax=Acidithrix ferrooxidans TaxID=1280514 RepID=A0A0D8HDN7_9ACTN|nr:beta-glucuronidase [Acidithrix ferrooxidans]
MLYPISTDTRAVIDLSGIWSFVLGTSDEFDETFVDHPLVGAMPMAVPASYNDLGVTSKIRNHVGWVCYESTFSVPSVLLSERVVLRFGSVTHFGRVFINGKYVGEHNGGFTPFEFEINKFLISGPNRLSVMVNNVVDETTLPVGTYFDQEISGLGRVVKNTPNFDFFNYAGIHRPVKIYTTPRSYISDLSVVTSTVGSLGHVQVDVEVVGGANHLKMRLRDEDGNLAASGDGPSKTLEIGDVVLWEPLDAYLYNLEVDLCENGVVLDTYSIPVGVRTVDVRDAQFLINGKPFYFKGFGKHEDSSIHGRGFDEALNVADFNLAAWIGANSFRTAHYPYSEEILRLADRQGIVVIDETPAVGLHLNFAAVLFGSREHRNTWEHIGTFANHQKVIEELVARDKNHPSVVMWSIANEPASEEAGARQYFAPLVELARKCDPQKRPVTIVTHQWATPGVCEVAELVDVLALNRYYGWYVDSGDLEAAGEHLHQELIDWHNLHPQKPILMTEYGADTVAGLHDVDPVMFTEEFQSLFLSTYHEVFDKCSWVVGEQVWNFADFATSQGVLRVQGNKKGVFTRDRKPKAAAHELRRRWSSMANYNYK